MSETVERLAKLEAIRERNHRARERLGADEPADYLAQRAQARAEGFTSHSMTCPIVGVVTYDQLMEDVPALLERVEELEAEVSRLRAAREVAEPHQIEHEVELIARCLYRRKLVGAWINATTEEWVAYRALAVEERTVVMREAAKEAANLPRIEGAER